MAGKTPIEQGETLSRTRVFVHTWNRMYVGLWESISFFTLTKASLQSEACLELRGLVTLSLMVMMERLVKLEASKVFLTFRKTKTR